MRSKLIASLKLLPAMAVIAFCFTLAPGASAESLDNCRPFTPEVVKSLQGRTCVVADIDGVLTQYMLQDYGSTNGIFLDTGDAYPRQDAALLMNLYYRKGYFIIYMAGRPRNMMIAGKTSCQATLDWLRANGFPTERDQTLLLLHDGSGSVIKAKNPGQAMAEMMGEQGTQMFTKMLAPLIAGYKLKLAYGYVDSDEVTDAFIASGVPAGHIFSIGNIGISRLGYRGSHAIVGPEPNPGWSGHIKEFVVPKVPNLKRGQ